MGFGMNASDGWVRRTTGEAGGWGGLEAQTASRCAAAKRTASFSGRNGAGADLQEGGEVGGGDEAQEVAGGVDDGQSV